MSFENIHCTHCESCLERVREEQTNMVGQLGGGVAGSIARDTSTW